MGKIKIPNNRNVYSILLIQKKYIEMHFQYLKCTISRNTLKCTGILQPHNKCDSYKIRIIYEVGKKPKIYILNPQINYNDQIHLFSDNSLCLYHFTDLEWDDNKIIIAKTIIPWISEWILFYEIWKINGVWLGAEIKHKPNEIKK
jgi:hypothetical protein